MGSGGGESGCLEGVWRWDGNQHPFPQKDTIARGGFFVCDNLTKILRHFLLTVMRNYSAILPVSCTGQCVSWVQKLRKLHGET